MKENNMDSFIIQKDRYFAAVDFGAKEYPDLSVMIVAKQNDDGTIEIIDSKRFGLSKDFKEESKREEYINMVNKLLDFYPKRTKIGELQTLGDNDDRDILQVLRGGDYIVGYNGDRGTITEVNYPYIVVEYADIKRDIHVCNVKQFIFN